MTNAKRFDSVKMKSEIQARLTHELASLTVEQRKHRADKVLRDDDTLASIWHRAKRPLKRAV